MTKQEKKYLKKRDRVARVIVEIRITYENWREEVYVETNPDPNVATEAAEKILSKFGINKPQSLIGKNYGIATYKKK